MDFIISSSKLTMPISSYRDDDTFWNHRRSSYVSNPGLRRFLLSLVYFDYSHSVLFEISGNNCKITTCSYDVNDGIRLPDRSFEFDINGLEETVRNLL